MLIFNKMLLRVVHILEVVFLWGGCFEADFISLISVDEIVRFVLVIVFIYIAVEKFSYRFMGYIYFGEKIHRNANYYSAKC